MMSPSGSAQRGFTLIEMLVAVVIVAISVTVFFQLLSSSMKLAHKSRVKLARAQQADELFARLLAMDIRDEKFPWQSDAAAADGVTWQVHLYPLLVQDDLSAAAADYADDNLPEPKLVYELYRQRLQMYNSADGRLLAQLETVRRFPPTYFTEQFKQQHLESESMSGDDRGGEGGHD